MFTILVVLCTFSKMIESFLNNVDHTGVAYLKCGLTKDLYKLRNISLSISYIFIDKPGEC